MNRTAIEELQMHGQDIPWLLGHWASHKPDHPALVWDPPEGEGRQWTYAELLEATRGLADDVEQVGLGDRGLTAGVLDEVLHLIRDRTGVGGDRHRAERGAGQPGHEHLGGVLGVDEHLVSPPHAVFAETHGQAPGGFEEVGVGPLPTLALGRIPDERRMVRLVGRPVPEQPGDVLAVHLQLVDRGALHRRLLVASLRRFERKVGKAYAPNGSRRLATTHMAKYCAAAP